MHYLAPIPILFGIAAIIVGLLWLVAAGSDKDGGPESHLFFLFGVWYIGLRVLRALFAEPMSVLPAFCILFGGGVLIWLGLLML